MTLSFAVEEEQFGTHEQAEERFGGTFSCAEEEETTRCEREEEEGAK